MTHGTLTRFGNFYHFYMPLQAFPFELGQTAFGRPQTDRDIGSSKFQGSVDAAQVLVHYQDALAAGAQHRV